MSKGHLKKHSPISSLVRFPANCALGVAGIIFLADDASVEADVDEYGNVYGEHNEWNDLLHLRPELQSFR